MNKTILKVIEGKMPKPRDVYDDLYEICCEVHATCYNACPVFKINGSKVPCSNDEIKFASGCDCFKNGKAMYNFIKERL